MEFERFAFRFSMSFRILLYRSAILLVNLSDPKIIIGIGIKANTATNGEMYKNIPPITTTVVAVWTSLFAPLSKKVSNWLTSSFKIAINLPEDLFSKKAKSSPRTLLKVSVLKECSIS